MKKYYIHNGTAQEGPFSLDELRSKKIQKITPVWHEGLSDWTTAESIEELSVLFTMPPPFKDKSTPPPFENQKTGSPKAEEKKPEPDKAFKQTAQVAPKKKSRLGKILAYGFIVALLTVGVVVLLNILAKENGSELFDGSSNDSYEEKVMTVEEEEQANPLRFLSASGTYRSNFWGDKIKIECEVTNNATVAVYKDAVIEFTYYSASGTAIGNEYKTLYQKFKPGSNETFSISIPNYTDVSTVGWEVIDAVAL